MDELQARLTTLLTERYEVLREIGRGGMATVYLARDRRHQRQVAIKVFRSDVAAGVGHDRFVREISLAAKLSHPNILPLYDSGDTDGLLYYVMPYIAGESVGARLAREGQLPIGEALAIARQVAAALHYAHGAGVVHRDIKPDNILVAGDHVLVADFGIAYAVEQTGDQTLTAAGYAVGTPAYMSPEQSTAAGRIDGRSDIYSLGCVLYTMLIGEPPFSGPTAHATLARHLAEAVPSLRVVRSTIPPVVEAAVHRALAKSPADRFATAAEFADAISPEHLSDAALARIAPAPRYRRWLGVAAVVVCLLAVAAMVIRPWSLIRGSGKAPMNLDVVAVTPFHGGVMLDSSMQRLVAGVADLVVQRLPGDGGPRAIAAGADRILDDRAAIAAARSAGAGSVIQGNVSVTGGRLSFSATLKAIANDSILARVDDATGAVDSVPATLDRLVAELLVRGSHIPESERAAISRLPLPAVRVYLAAERAFIRGQFVEARQLYLQVLQADSNCYPAALGLGAVAIVQPDTTDTRRAITLAQMHSREMSMSDSLYLVALTWPLEQDANVADRLARFDRAARVDPTHSAIPWYLLGERLFHDGPLLGLPDVLHRAAASFDQALKLEPDFIPALGAAIDLAAERRDTSALRSLAARYFVLDSTSALADYYRWRVAVAFDDQPALHAIRGRIGQFETGALERIVNVAQIDGVALVDAERAAAALWQQGGNGRQTRWAFIKQRELALNRGRPAEAQQILDHWRAGGLFSEPDGLNEVVNTLYWGADTLFPATWVREVSPLTDAGRPAAGRPSDWYLDICGVGLWRINHGNADGVAAGIRQLRTMNRLTPDFQDMALCADVIDADLAQRTGARDARARLMRLDSIARSAPPITTWILAAANLTAARLWEAAGAPDKALAAVRRRPYITDLGEPRVLVALSTMLREEGRLAALTGDTTSAIVAYGRYLALRDAPEPAVAAEVAAVRAALARLESHHS